MIAGVLSSGVLGVEGLKVVVECEGAGGLTAFEIVGLPETSVKESRVRIRAAMESAGLEFPSRRITVNLAPADIPKRGTIYDLPMALAIAALCAEGTSTIRNVYQIERGYERLVDRLTGLGVRIERGTSC